MSLIKLAADQIQPNQRRNRIGAWVGETGGIAIADAIARSAFKPKGQRWAHFAEGLKEGALFGGVLATAEPAIKKLIVGKQPNE